MIFSGFFIGSNIVKTMHLSVPRFSLNKLYFCWIKENLIGGTTGGTTGGTIEGTTIDDDALNDTLNEMAR